MALKKTTTVYKIVNNVTGTLVDGVWPTAEKAQNYINEHLYSRYSVLPVTITTEADNV